MKTPPPWARICGTKAWAVSRIDFTLTAKMRSNSASCTSISGLFLCVVPALLTTMSIRPNAAIASRAARSTSSRFETSARSAIEPPPNRLAAASATSPLRSRHATRAPSRTNASAMPNPNPCPAPVTSAFLPFSRMRPPLRQCVVFALSRPCGAQPRAPHRSRGLAGRPDAIQRATSSARMPGACRSRRTSFQIRYAIRHRHPRR